MNSNICRLKITSALFFLIIVPPFFLNSSRVFAFTESWENSSVSTYITNLDEQLPLPLISADEGNWWLDDTVSSFPEDCGQTPHTAEIISVYGGKALKLTSNNSNSECSDNIWLSLNEFLPLDLNGGFSIPLENDTYISFEHEGDLVSPQVGSSSCLMPPCGDTISLILSDSNDNVLSYIMQRATEFVANTKHSNYREVLLDSSAAIYSRNLFNDFSSIPDFNPNNASIEAIQYQVDEHGWGVIDNIIISTDQSDIPSITGNNEIAISELKLSKTGHLQVNDPVTVTANAADSGGQPIYYKFYYCANYGTDEYATTPWSVVQDYSTTNSAVYTFPSSGNYIIVVRAVTDPNNEPEALPIIGQAVVVGDESEVSLVSMTTDSTTETNAGDTVTVTATASGPDGQTLYYQFYYCANYGTSSYDTTPWTLVQDYSTSNSCQYVFPSDGNYIIVVRAVIDPYNEPTALPIVGNSISIGDP